MWKLDGVERTAEEWATIVECIAIYADLEKYPDREVIMAMLGIKKAPAEEND